MATGPAAASRQAVGTAVFGGMLVATFLTVLFVPVFFRVFQAAGERYFGEGAGRDERRPDAVPTTAVP